MDQYFLIVIVNNPQNVTKTLDSIFELVWENSLLNSHVLIQEQPNYWSIYTFMPYQRDCIALDAVRIATFTPMNFTNNISATFDEMFPEKLNDFYKCPLYVATALLEPFASLTNGSDGKPQFKGIDIEILKHISRALNFGIIYERATNSAGHGFIHTNGTFTENLALVRFFLRFFFLQSFSFRISILKISRFS